MVTVRPGVATPPNALLTLRVIRCACVAPGPERTCHAACDAADATCWVNPRSSPRIRVRPPAPSGSGERAGKPETAKQPNSRTAENQYAPFGPCSLTSRFALTPAGRLRRFRADRRGRTAGSKRAGGRRGRGTACASPQRFGKPSLPMKCGGRGRLVGTETSPGRALGRARAPASARAHAQQLPCQNRGNRSHPGWGTHGSEGADRRQLSPGIFRFAPMHPHRHPSRQVRPLTRANPSRRLLELPPGYRCSRKARKGRSSVPERGPAPAHPRQALCCARGCA